MTLVEHLDELRTRIIVSAIVLVLAIAFCFWQNHALLEIANKPLPRDLDPLTFSPTEPFFTTVKLSIYGGVLLALPILLYQIYAFVLPAFSPGEKRVVLPMLLMVPVLFIAGTVFGYFVVLPPALKFLLGFNIDQFNIEIRASEYYGFFILTLIGVGHPVPDSGRRARGDQARDRHPAAARPQPPLRDPGHRRGRDAAPRHRPGDDADLDGAALSAVRVLGAAGPPLATRHEKPTRTRRSGAARPPRRRAERVLYPPRPDDLRSQERQAPARGAGCLRLPRLHVLHQLRRLWRWLRRHRRDLRRARDRGRQQLGRATRSSSSRSRTPRPRSRRTRKAATLPRT